MTDVLAQTARGLKKVSADGSNEMIETVLASHHGTGLMNLHKKVCLLWLRTDICIS